MEPNYILGQLHMLDTQDQQSWSHLNSLLSPLAYDPSGHEPTSYFETPEHPPIPSSSTFSPLEAIDGWNVCSPSVSPVSISMPITPISFHGSMTPLGASIPGIDPSADSVASAASGPVPTGQPPASIPMPAHLPPPPPQSMQQQRIRMQLQQPPQASQPLPHHHQQQHQMGLPARLPLPQNPKKQFQCHQCGRSYLYQKHLSRHFKTHTGIRPYVCQYCKATFTRSDTLKRHRERCAAHYNKDYTEKPPRRKLSRTYSDQPIKSEKN